MSFTIEYEYCAKTGENSMCYLGKSDDILS